MAGIKNSFGKGLAAINVKTSNFMEENKLKTSIATQEAEIERLKLALGDAVYRNWERGSLTMETMENQLQAIREKYRMIVEMKKQIEDLSQNEKQILGGDTAGSGSGKIFCDKCGAEVKAGSRFCTKCGNKIAEG